MMKVSEDLLAQHYQQLRSKPFYPDLVQYMTSGPVVVMVSDFCSDAPFVLLLLKYFPSGYADTDLLN